MFSIIPQITSVVQYLVAINCNPESLIPEHCPKCKNNNFIHHGCYHRNINYSKSEFEERISNIPIMRYYCKSCDITFSALPECIPPHRNYTWEEQQSAIEPVLDGESCQSVSNHCKPSRWTISRWFRRLRQQAKKHLDCFKTLLPELGRVSEFAKSWMHLLKQYTLAQLMRILHQADITIP